MDSMRRGLVFTADGILAVSAALVLAVGSFLYIQDVNRSQWNDVNMMRTAYDLGLALDRDGILPSNNRTLIEDMLKKTMPDNMNVSLQIQRYYFVEGNLSLIDSRRYGQDVGGNHMTQRVVSTDPKGGYYITDVRVGLR
ncbi:MAG: hypothetical protein V1744_06135 [Candidatus Altiarchaeota archaeon]